MLRENLEYCLTHQALVFLRLFFRSLPLMGSDARQQGEAKTASTNDLSLSFELMACKRLRMVSFASESGDFLI